MCTHVKNVGGQHPMWTDLNNRYNGLQQVKFIETVFQIIDYKHHIQINLFIELGTEYLSECFGK